MLKVRFHDCMAGWISLTIKGKGQVELVEFSAYTGEDDFSILMQWLEALVVRQDAHFKWDSEGYIAECKYSEGIFALSKDEKCLVQCPIDRMALVPIFYEAFLSFTQSDEYRPSQWAKWKTRGAGIEATFNCLLTRNEIIEVFLGMNDRLLVEIESKSNPRYRFRFIKEIDNSLRRYVFCLLRPCETYMASEMVDEPTYLELPDDFEDWTHSKRKKWLENYWDKGDGEEEQRDLCELRSSEIERALQKR